MADELARAVAFQQGFARRKAQSVVEVPGGFAVLNDRYPGSHDDNKLVIRSAADPRDVLAAADRVLARRGHRLVNVDDDELGRAYMPAFTAAGYAPAANLVMVYRGETPRDAPPAERLGLSTLTPVLRREWRESLPEAPDDVIDQLARRVGERTRGADLVGFRGVRAPDGTLAARADLYVHEGTAQIEDVYTDARHRGRGHARALLRSLLAEAAGSDLIFLVADDGDWPKGFYARLGFEAVGRTHSFTRT
jgi:ribosomal protein S18 acetylase RimI-like enzyme